MSDTRWLYWDVLAFVASVVPIVLAIIANMIDLHYGGMAIFVGSAGSGFLLTAYLSVAMFLVSAVAGWRSGHRWLIAAGGVLLLLGAAPSLLLLAGCALGDCI